MYKTAHTNDPLHEIVHSKVCLLYPYWAFLQCTRENHTSSWTPGWVTLDTWLHAFPFGTSVKTLRTGLDRYLIVSWKRCPLLRQCVQVFILPSQRGKHRCHVAHSHVGQARACSEADRSLGGGETG